MTDEPNNMTMHQAYKKALANGMISSEPMVAAILVAANDQSVSFNDAFAAMASDLADALLADDKRRDEEGETP